MILILSILKIKRLFPDLFTQTVSQVPLMQMKFYVKGRPRSPLFRIFREALHRCYVLVLDGPGLQSHPRAGERLFILPHALVAETTDEVAPMQLENFECSILVLADAHAGLDAPHRTEEYLLLEAFGPDNAKRSLSFHLEFDLGPELLAEVAERK
jgi:hypothetical protein